MIPAFFTKLFGSSWQTTVFGIVGGASIVWIPALTATPARLPTKNEWVIGIIVGVLGWISKYQKTTGV
jgi:hypothetical protein